MGIRLKLIECDSVWSGRDSLGDGTMVGDRRWAGAYGVDADLIARSHCAVEFIRTEDIEATILPVRSLLGPSVKVIFAFVVC